MHKELSDNEIINLLNDAEQGVIRTTTELLPRLVTEKSNLDKIFEVIINKSHKEGRDVKVERLAISSLLTLNIPKGIFYLKNLFPVRDIGTPKRILEWMDNNFDSINVFLSDPEILSLLQKLLVLCRDYQKTSELLLELYESISNKINDYMSGKSLNAV